MESDWVVEIIWYKRLVSTQTHLIQGLKEGRLTPPVCVWVDAQEAGEGSRGNTWIGYEGNWFASFALERSALSTDVRLESSSIYVAWILRDLLVRMGSRVWLKWPNDLYLEEMKIGGVITHLVHNTLVWGIGLNLAKAPEGFGTLDIALTPVELTRRYCEALETLPTWKEVFSRYEIEFQRSKPFLTHTREGEVIDLRHARLCEDGSLEYKGQRIVSLR